MTYLYKRTKNYYLRMAVPRDLRAHFPCREIIKSLKTPYYDQARCLARELTQRLAWLFTSIRSGIMDQQQIAAAIAAFFEQRVRDGKLDALDYAGKYSRQHGWFDTTTPSLQADRYQHISQTILKKLGCGDTGGMEAAVKEVFAITPADAGYHSACMALLAEEVKVYAARAKIAAGDPTAYDELLKSYAPPVASSAPVTVTVAPPALPGATTPTKKLSEVIKLLTKQKSDLNSVNENSAYENERNYGVVLFVVEDIEMNRLDKYEFAYEIMTRFKSYPKNKSKNKRFKEKTIHEIIKMPDVAPLSDSRVNKYLEHLSGLINFAIKGGWMRVNYIEDLYIKTKSDPAEEWDAYDKDDITNLVAGLEKCFNKKQPEKLWIATMMLFLGARPADLVRLTKDKFKTIDGIPCVNLKSKTDAGVRTVPLHPHLLECGFQRFLDTIPEGGKLWSDKLNFRQKDQDNHERWYNRTFEPKYVTDAEKKSLYSIRHAFITSLKHAYGNLFVIKEIVGHEKGLPEKEITFGRYGKKYPPATKLKTMKKLNYGVDLAPFITFCKSIDW